MKKFVLTLLLSAFVFICVHDYIIETIDQDTQSELYLYDAGQISSVCDITQTHEVLHDTLIAIDVIHSPLCSQYAIHSATFDETDFSPTSFPKGIFYPPIA